MTGRDGVAHVAALAEPEGAAVHGGFTVPKRGSDGETNRSEPAAPVHAEERHAVREAVRAAAAVAHEPSGKRKTRVLLADDHQMMREGLAALLRRESDIEMVGEAVDGAEAVELARRFRPDVVIMDVTMPRMNGIEATRRIVAKVAGVSVIGLSMHEEADMAAAMREAGASDYLTKDCPPELLVAAICACRPRGADPHGGGTAPA